MTLRSDNTEINKEAQVLRQTNVMDPLHCMLTCSGLNRVVSYVVICTQ